MLGHRILGKGPERVFLFNDWMADCTSWEPTLPYLDGVTFTYCLADLRGYGRSMDQKGEYNELEAAADIVKLADHLGWSRFHLVGFSMTGMVVERLAIDVPDRVKSVVAVGPVSAAGVRLSADERQFFIDVITDDNKARELAARITGHRLSSQWEEVKLKLARTTRTAEAAHGYLDMWTLHDFSAEAGNSRVPFLIVAGRYDHPSFLPDELRRTFLAWHPDAEVVTLDCGHCPMQEMPVALQTVMERFMRTHCGSADACGSSDLVRGKRDR